MSRFSGFNIIKMREILFLYQMSMKLPGEGIASRCVRVEHQLLLLMVQLCR